MNTATRRYVFDRDRMCMAHVLDWAHVCRDEWGDSHPPEDLSALTIEHVRTDPGGARRDDPAHLVAMCHRANDQHWGSSTENRALLNAYLLGTVAKR